MTIEENNVCCHFKEVWLDKDFGSKNPQIKNNELVAIMGKVKPSGPKGSNLQDSLNNPDENVCFSIRALTKDYYNRGQVYRILNQIFTFDNVIECGILTSNKWNSPALEGDRVDLEDIVDMIIRERQIEKIATTKDVGIAVEQSRIMALETLDIFRDHKGVARPTYINW
jgi:hypothetical protein